MRTIMVMFDSLNRRCLPNYGCDWVKAPNFERLGKHTVTFDNCWTGSLPCMPARRELHTGRLNFLHRSWGPLEPYDDSMPEILKNNGIYSHLVTDHQHYWEDGGATYHTRYASYEFSRGQEGDPWKGVVKDPEKLLKHPYMSKCPKPLYRDAKLRLARQDVINRDTMKNEDRMSQMVTFRRGLEFIETNHEEDNWFLQIETFDPHEPFFSSQRFHDMYPENEYRGPDTDWPPYGKADQSDDVQQHLRNRYASLVSMCDENLGKVLDMMDRYNMWKDTMLIVNTDHGYLLGEHGWWAKSVMPDYVELTNIPFFVWDPRCGIKDVHRHALVQTIDIAPTILEFFGQEIPKDMEGHALKDVIVSDEEVRSAALFGYFGTQINVTDGRYVYMRCPASRENQPLHEHILMPTHMRCRYSCEELKTATLCEPFSFTKGAPLMKVDVLRNPLRDSQYCNLLFDLEEDPGQLHPLNDDAKEVEMANIMIQLMKANDAPAEQYERMGLPSDGEYTLDMHKAYIENL